MKNIIYYQFLNLKFILYCIVYLLLLQELTVRSVIMDSLFTQNVSDEAEDIPLTDEPVWILGKKYNALKGLINDQSVYYMRVFPMK